MLRTVVSQLWNFLFPETCLGCKTAGSMLCDSCLAKIPPPREHIAETLSLFDYRDNTLRQIIHLFKYRNGQRIGFILGGALYEKITKEMKGGGALFNLINPILIPVPLSKKKLKKRGFNQSEILVNEIFTQDIHKKFRKELSVLFRKDDATSQVSIKDRNARIQNVKGCFEVRNKERIDGENILLIDDVTTTGATIEEARKVLLSAGARRVVGVTVAH